MTSNTIRIIGGGRRRMFLTQPKRTTSNPIGVNLWDATKWDSLPMGFINGGFHETEMTVLRYIKLPCHAGEVYEHDQGNSRWGDIGILDATGKLIASSPHGEDVGVFRQIIVPDGGVNIVLCAHQYFGDVKGATNGSFTVRRIA